MRRVLAAGFLVGIALLPAAARAEDAAIHACDLAAANPLDTSRPAGVPGVDFNKIDITAAMPACKAALAAKPENPRLLYQMGRILSVGKDYAQAAGYLKKAAASSYAIARFELGGFYLSGVGELPRDYAQFVSLTMLASEQGLPIADYTLCLVYENGRAGLPKDAERAIRYFTLAADKGLADAQIHLGVIYGTGGDGRPMDEAKAATLFKLAATQGNRSGQFNLGLLYESGRGGLPKSDTDAARLYKLAADQGFSEAEYRLALFYEAGRGGLQKNDKEAARLFKLAADHGSMGAQSHLEYSHGAGGVVLPLDSVNAFREHLRKYWNLPRGVDANSNLRVTLRVKLNPDGRLNQAPIVIEGSHDPAGPVFAQSAVKALELAQPFTMLKPENYNQWKDLELVFDSRMFANAGGGGAVDVGGMTDAAGTEGPH
jgi:TPR repeat protein